MDAFVNFIKEYGALILAAVSVLVGIICIFVKRRPKTLDDWKATLCEVASYASSYVLSAEKVFGRGLGIKKKNYVLSSLLDDTECLFGRKLTNDEKSEAEKYFELIIEGILSAPQRKEVADEAKNGSQS